MNITSLLITLAGIIFIIALYIISRISQSKLPSKQTTRLPNLKDENGNRFTSLLDDIPARDGSTPQPDNVVQNAKQELEKTTQTKETEDIINDEDKNKDKEKATTGEKQGEGQNNNSSTQSEKQQHILFISARDEKGLDGRLVRQALKANGLVLGDMDIYHYFPVMQDSFPETEKYSLFRIANGVSPWTLKPEDLLNKNLAGLSIVMITPTKINDSEAIALFISLSEKICKQVGGVLKNPQQQLFTAKDKKYLLHLYKN